MKDNVFRKGMVCGIIILFIGVGVVPSISGNNGINSVINAADNIPNTISRTSIYNGSLSGYVNDISMNPIAGVRVRVYFHGTYEENYSDPSGYYHVTNIPICYCLKNATAFKEGYKTEWVMLSITKNTTYDFVLTPLSCYPVFDGTMGANGWYVSCVTITFVYDPEVIAEVHYKIDIGSWQIYTEPFVICEDGLHTIYYYAVDMDGNQGLVQEAEFKIDQTPPVTTIEFGKPYYKDSDGNIYITSDTPIYLNAMDNESGVNATYYRINNGNWEKYVAPFSIPEDCDHRICFYSVDDAGNKETIKNENVSVDNYPPYPVLSPPCPNGNNGWYTSSVFVSFADAKSDVIYVQYRINGGYWIIYVNPILIGSDGWYTIDYYAIDTVGNEGTGSFSVKIDQTPPTTTHEFAGIMGDNDWYVSDVTVTLSAEDETSGVDYTMYKLDDGEWTTYTDPFVVTEDGEHILYYYSVDIAGNEEDVNEADLKIDQTTPTIFLTVEKVDDNTWLFTADVFDETSGIAKVEFYVNDEYVGEVTEYPYEWIYNTTPSTRFSVKGLIFNPKITEETVSFFAVIAIGRHYSIPDRPKALAIAYDNAGNEAISIPTSPIDLELYFYIFEQLTFQNDYSGYIGDHFIFAVFGLWASVA